MQQLYPRIGRVSLHRLVSALSVLLAVVGATPTTADDCPASFPAQAPEMQDGGIFYLSSNNSWEPLVSGRLAFAGKLQVIFVPRPDLCTDTSASESAAKRPDCGDKGFVLFKTVKETGAASDRIVMLERGKKFAAETNFHAFAVELDRYQTFHEAANLLASRIREEWHWTSHDQGLPNSAFEPRAKRLQYAFPKDQEDGAWRKAFLMRFDTPEPAQVVCIPFSVDWNKPNMKLVLDVMLVDPVLDDFGFDPETFTIERAGR